MTYSAHVHKVTCQSAKEAHHPLKTRKDPSDNKQGLVGTGEGDNRGWDGWMASPTQWTWIWVDSGSWWWTGRPGVLRFMGSQRVGHDWATELNWVGIIPHSSHKKENSWLPWAAGEEVSHLGFSLPVLLLLIGLSTYLCQELRQLYFPNYN